MDMETNNRNRNSMRIDLEEVRLTDLKNEGLKPKETYKKLDSNGLDVGDTTVNGANMSRDIKVEDGADEKMLASPEENGGTGSDENQALTGKDVTIKFIPSGASEKNGDAKIDMKMHGEQEVMQMESSFTLASPSQNPSDLLEPIQTIYEKLMDNIYKLSRKRANLRSVAWDMFLPVQDDKGAIIPTIFACSKCTKVVRANGKNTTRLLMHDCVKKASSMSVKQNSPKFDASDRKKSVLAFMKFIVVDGRPYKTVEGVGFKDLIKFAIEMGHKYGKDIDIDAFIAQRKTLSRHISKMKVGHDELLRSELQEHASSGYSLTCDLWKDDDHSEQFLGLTIGYVKEHELFNYTLAVQKIDSEGFIVESIAKKILGTLAHYGLKQHKPHGATMVTIFGSDQAAACRSLDIDCLNCSSHLIDTVLSEALEVADDKITSMVTECRRAVSFMNSNATNYVLESSMKTICQTRWYYRYFVCDLVLINHEKLLESSVGVHIDRQLLTQLTAFLRVFKKAFEILEAPTMPTIHLVYPTLTRLESACAQMQSDLPPIVDLKTKVLANIDELFRPHMSAIHRAAVLLNPLSHQLRSLNKLEATEANEYVTAAMELLEQRSNNGLEVLPRVLMSDSLSLSEFAAPLVADHTSRDFAEDFAIEYAAIPVNAETYESVEQEFCRYKQRSFFLPSGHDPLTFDPLAFWNNRKGEFPRLSIVARKVFSIPATRAASERIFAKGHSLMGDRSSRSTENINDLLTMCANAAHFEWEISDETTG